MSTTLETIDLLIYVRAFWRRRYTVSAIFFVILLAAFIKTMFLSTHIFRATATIMSIKSERGFLGSLSPNLRSLSGLAGIGAGESDIDRFINILQSRTITEQVIDKLKLIEFFYPRVPVEKKEFLRYVLIRRMQDQILKVTSNKQGLVEVSVETKDPKMSSQIANSYVDLLEKYISENTLTAAKEHRNFVEKQFNRVKTDLAKAEEELKKFKQKHELISLNDEVTEMVKSLGQLKGQMLAKEFELEVLRKLGAAESNIQSKTLEVEIEGLKKQINSFESGGNPIGKLFSVSPSQLPELEVQMAKLMRDKTVQETLYGLLAQYYESAKLEEAREEPKFQRLDVAMPPMKKIKPQRKIDMLIGGLVGIAVVIAYVIVLEYIDKTRRNA